MNKTYSTLIIYYFSGTGNSKAVANWFEEEAKVFNVETFVFNIDRIENIEIPEFSGKALIGFGGPTHGFNMAPVLLKFIAKFPKKLNADYFLFNTRAGMKMHKLFMPGLSGVAMYLPSLILKLKGYDLRGWRSVDLPSNWISVHPGIKESILPSFFDRWEKKSKHFLRKLLDGKKSFPNWLIELPFNMAVSPVSLIYYLVGRFGLSKTYIANYKCNACGLCEKNCPTQSIKMIMKRPYWKFTCESCMRCMNACPKRAIETPHAFIFTLWYFIMVSSPLLLNKLFNLFDVKSYIASELLFTIAQAIYFLLMILIAYFLLHFLLRFKFFNVIIAKTSLSNYKFWRRYKFGLKRK